MSKKYRGKLCVYCCIAESRDGDHVFSREFFDASDRAGLPKAPACKACNTHKSDLEQYALSTLVLGNLHPSAQAHHMAKIPRRLGHNPRLRDSLLEAATEHWIPGAHGVLEQRFAIPIDSDRIDPLFAMIARGLAWHHWSTYLDRDALIDVQLPYKEAEPLYSDERYDEAIWSRVSSSLGSGTIEYTGWQRKSTPSATVWRITLLGGVTMGGGLNPAARTSSMFGVVTAPADAMGARDGA